MPLPPPDNEADDQFFSPDVYAIESVSTNQNPYGQNDYTRFKSEPFDSFELVTNTANSGVRWQQSAINHKQGNSFAVAQTYNVPVDLTVMDIENIIQSITEFGKNKTQDLPVNIQFLTQLFPLLQALSDNPYDPEDYNKSLQQLFTVDGCNFILNFITYLYISQEDSLLENTLKLFHPVSLNFNEDQIFCIQNLINTAILDQVDIISTAFFCWCESLILANKFSDLRKEVFLVDGVQQLIREEPEKFLPIIINCTDRDIQRALINASKYPSSYGDPQAAYQALEKEYLDSNMFVNSIVFRDIPRGWTYTIVIEGQKLVISAGTSMEQSCEMFLNFLKRTGLSKNAQRRLIDFIINFPSQGILSAYFKYKQNMFPLVLQSPTNLRVEFNDDDTTKIYADIQGTARTFVVIQDKPYTKNTKVSAYITYTYIGSWKENKSIPARIKVRSSSHIKTTN